MGRGLVDPNDDFRATNPPTNPELLDWLAKDFAAGGFRLKPLVKQIMMSRGVSTRRDDRATATRWATTCTTRTRWCSRWRRSNCSTRWRR